MYYKFYEFIKAANEEEKGIKGGSRKQKEILIHSINTEWKNLLIDTKNR